MHVGHESSLFWPIVVEEFGRLSLSCHNVAPMAEPAELFTTNHSRIGNPEIIMAATQKPNQASSKGKSFKRNESQESAHAARQRKRDAKRKGLKAGSRQAAAQDNGGSN